VNDKPWTRLGLSTETRETPLRRAVEILFREAALLDAWARESREGGWSTHQVDPMRRRADELRRAASEIQGQGEAASRAAFAASCRVRPVLRVVAEAGRRLAAGESLESVAGDYSAEDGAEIWEVFGGVVGAVMAAGLEEGMACVAALRKAVGGDLPCAGCGHALRNHGDSECNWSEKRAGYCQCDGFGDAANVVEMEQLRTKARAVRAGETT
jgi:hypothetical protein